MRRRRPKSDTLLPLPDELKAARTREEWLATLEDWAASHVPYTSPWAEALTCTQEIAAFEYGPETAGQCLRELVRRWPSR
ncbi:hypothetical protein [Occultella kanbiaonis]|uniref:hypothetical protein n=1 Tax=Occultella kanbiaonis TaxID=2675754 RepID=UPI0012B9CD11|nr:hypothetical protein [Occultella kanbiaonis]